MSAAMTNAERAKLIKLAHYAISLAERQNDLLSVLKGGPGEPPMPEELYVPVVTCTAKKLLVLGHLLGKDGQKFKTAGMQLLTEHVTSSTAEEKLRFWGHITNVAGFYKQRHDPGFIAAFNGNMVAKKESSDALFARLPMFVASSIRDYEAWVGEELLGVVISTGKDGKPKKLCCFCGTKERKDKKPLLPCGFCKSVLYCDVQCRKLDWKKVHEA